jgi:hypothetical protein
MAVVKYQHLKRLNVTPWVRPKGYNTGVVFGVGLGVLFATFLSGIHVLRHRPTLPDGWEEANKAYRKFNNLDPIHK